MSNWDGFWNDMDMAIQRDDFQKAVQIYESRIANLNDVAIDGQDTAAGLYGHREALLQQLARCDPNNPLIKDESLIQKIKKAAISAFRLGKPLDYGNAITVGLTFCIPGHEGPDKALAEALTAAELLEKQLAVTKQELEEARQGSVIWAKNYAGAYAVQQVFFHALEQLVPDHPLVKEAELRKSFNSAGVDIFIKNGYDINAVFYAIQAGGKKPGHSWIEAEHTMQPEHRDAFRLAAHRLACARLRDNPALFADPIRVLTGWAEQSESSGQTTAILERWVDLLTVNKKDPQALNLMFAESCEDSPAGRELRTGSPLLFVLSQPELRELRERIKGTSSNK